jgi:hypothetical protein
LFLNIYKSIKIQLYRYIYNYIYIIIEINQIINFLRIHIYNIYIYFNINFWRLLWYVASRSLWKVIYRKSDVKFAEFYRKMWKILGYTEKKKMSIHVLFNIIVCSPWSSVRFALGCFLRFCKAHC